MRIAERDRWTPALGFDSLPAWIAVILGGASLTMSFILSGFFAQAMAACGFIFFSTGCGGLISAAIIRCRKSN